MITMRRSRRSRCGDLSGHDHAVRAIGDAERLFGDLVAERQLLIGVATGGPRIRDVDDYYRVRRKRLRRLLEERGLEDPNPFPSLWEWYNRWSAEFGTYKERRGFVRDLYAPLIDKLCAHVPEPVPAREPTGWELVDRVMEKARSAMMRARTAEDFQSIGLLCREMLISLGQAVYVVDRHPTLDGVAASTTDAKRMLEAYIAVELGGNANESLRKYARAALELASTLVHKRTATVRFAALCLEATSSVVNTIAIASGRRDALNE